MVLSAASDNSTATNGIVDLGFSDTQVYFQLSNMNFKNFTEAGVRNIDYAPGAFRDRWTFLAIALDNGRTSGFVNGTEAWVGKDVGCMTLKSYGIGGEDFSPFNGVIKNVSLYDIGLSSNQIEQLYSGKPVSSGLVSYWSMNDGHGCVVRDSVGNSSGTIGSCITVPPASIYNPNPESGQNGPMVLPDTVSLASGQRANLTVAVQFSDGTRAQASSYVVVL